MADKEQIERIEKMEDLFNKAGLLLAVLEGTMGELEEVLEPLMSYYQSEEWLKDFESDENGDLPEDLKRGVLSEDGMQDLLERIAVLSGEDGNVSSED